VLEDVFGIYLGARGVGERQGTADVEVEIGAERSKMVARRASPDEHAALWPRLVAMYPDFDGYQARTTRTIPVVILSPSRP